jgi:hypothetical protein
MFDTLRSNMSIAHLTNKEKFAKASLLNKVTEVNNDFGYSIGGNYNGMQIKITENKIHLHGSLSKFAFGDNIQTLNRKATFEAVNSLSEAFKMDFGDMNLTRIDISNNFIMKHPPEVYWDKLGDLRYFNKIVHNNGVYFNKKNEQLLLYGKLNEYKVKGLEIPSIYKGLNMLRYEYRLIGRISKTLNQNEVKMLHLYNEEFYINLLKLWQEKYFQIRKLNNISMKPTTSAKQLEQIFASMYIQSLGQDKCLNMVKEWQKTNSLDRKTAYDMRNKIKSLNNLKDIAEESQLIKELDCKIKDSISNFR